MTYRKKLNLIAGAARGGPIDDVPLTYKFRCRCCGADVNDDLSDISNPDMRAVFKERYAKRFCGDCDPDRGNRASCPHGA